MLIFYSSSLDQTREQRLNFFLAFFRSPQIPTDTNDLSIREADFVARPISSERADQRELGLSVIVWLIANIFFSFERTCVFYVGLFIPVAGRSGNSSFYRKKKNFDLEVFTFCKCWVEFGTNNISRLHFKETDILNICKSLFTHTRTYRSMDLAPTGFASNQKSI